jgi:lysophospholipase L1-like esterase
VRRADADGANRSASVKPSTSRSAATGWGIVLTAGLALSACGGSPTGPTTPPAALILTCPPSQTADSHMGQPALVTWETPVPQGGTAPATTTCSPASGQPFPVGTTPVTCTATDAVAHTASCGFQVIVARIPVLSATRFAAFGDSMTEGKVSLTAFPEILVTFPQAYTFDLLAMLSDRYRDQSFDVINEGLGGEFTADGVRRLPGVLAADAPEVLLLLEGANDLLNFQGAAIPGIVRNLDTMVQTARGRGVTVFLANHPPQRASGIRGQGAPYVVPLNGEIAALARRDGVPLVDVYTVVNRDPEGNIGSDGLHLTEQGYAAMARAFHDSITATLEVRTAR